MKSAVFAFTLVAAVAAQDIAALAQCGQTCASNMMAAGKAEELGCKGSDLKCLCANANFMYGLRDCSRAICSEQDSNKVVEYGLRVCKDAGVEVTGGSGGNGGNGGDGEASQSGGNGGSSETGKGGASETGGSGDATHSEGGSGSKATTIYTVATGTDGNVVTSPVATSIIEGGSGGSGGSVVTFSSDGSEVVSTLTTMMSNPTGTDSSGATETGSGSETSSGDSDSDSSSTGGSGASETGGSGSETTDSHGASSTSEGFAAQMTAAPGLLAVVGIAALLI